VQFKGAMTFCTFVHDISLRKEGEQRVSEFYSTVSHELRTPLTSINGALRLMEGGKAGELSARAQHLVTVGRAECDRLVRLINDILDIRKIQAGKMQLTLETIESKQIIDQTVEAINSLASESGITLQKQISVNPSIHVDKDRIIQVLTNLVSNAIKFAPRDSDIEIATSLYGNHVKLSVTDHGPGISYQNQRKLFKLFQQVDSTDSRPKGGTGLGLAISKVLVEEHKGTIGVDSKEGAGATFWFTLPVSD
jgi:signal transduction histidine kinase